MPDVSGADLYHFVADKISGFEQHMIFMTGGAYTAVLKKFMTTIHNTCLDKPLPEELLQRIEQFPMTTPNNKSSEKMAIIGQFSAEIAHKSIIHNFFRTTDHHAL